MKRKAEAFGVAALLLLGFGIRFYPALSPHFGFDEIYTVAMTRHSLGEIMRIGAADMHPPLYYDWVKLLAAIGLGLGGIFTTLAWLRLASILPGMAACAMGWWLARCCWGRRPGLWVLAAFALSPALTYYSVELRCYSTLHALLLGAMIGFLRATGPRDRARRPGALLFAACSLAAFYTHSLSTLYIGGFGLIFLAELGRGRLRGKAAWRVAAAAGLLAAGCAPWVRFMFQQTASLNSETWFEWAQWRTLRSTFFWYMPLGPLQPDGVADTDNLLVMYAFAAGLILLLANALLIARASNSRKSAPDTGDGHFDRLLFYSGLLAVIPVLAGFFLSYFHIAKVFLGFRYNLVPAPFITLALTGLILKIEMRFLRTAAFGALLAIWVFSNGRLYRQRLDHDDVFMQAARARPELINPKTRLVWNNPTVLPWLGRCRGSKRIGSSEEILHGSAPFGGKEEVYLLTHLALDGNYCGLLHRPSYLLKEILMRDGLPSETLPGSFDGLWRLASADLPRVRKELKQASERIEARRRSIPGGQVVLADEEAFNMTPGWQPLSYGPTLLPERWSAGSHAHLSWTGPNRAGLYRFRLIFRRPYPFPAEKITVHCRIPGEKTWRRIEAGTGRVSIEGKIQVRKPGQQMLIELAMPTWIPAQCLDQCRDTRPRGMLFEALELHPQSIQVAGF